MEEDAAQDVEILARRGDGQVARVATDRGMEIYQQEGNNRRTYPRDEAARKESTAGKPATVRKDMEAT